MLRPYAPSQQPPPHQPADFSPISSQTLDSFSTFVLNSCQVREQTYWRPVMLFVAIAVVLCAAYLLWQIWEADLADDR